MGRPPCCDKMGVKKGPWTPEEDIVLVSYVQEHGPSYWRAVPINTGLRRCSKSCRLRWTNYLRPGIKRGSFTDQEEKMIIQLQALLGNKWAAIASYLPERTDNDIKNYWNTHLKKKLMKQKQITTIPDHHRNLQESFKISSSSSSSQSSCSNSVSRGQWEKRLQTDIHTAKKALHEALSSSSMEESTTTDEKHDRVITKKTLLASSNDRACLLTSSSTYTCAYSYASSTENIARLLKDWVSKPSKSTPNTPQHGGRGGVGGGVNHNNDSDNNNDNDDKRGGIDLSEAFESLFGFESFESNSSSDASPHQSASPEAISHFRDDNETKHDLAAGADDHHLSMLENWLFEEGGKGNFSSFADVLSNMF